MITLEQFSMCRFFNHLLIVCLLSTFAGCINNGDIEAVPANNALHTMATNFRVGSTDGWVNTEPTPEYFKKRDLTKSPVPAFIVLDEPPAAEKEKLIAKNTGRNLPTGIGRVAVAPIAYDGYDRPILQTATAQATKRLLNWQKTASGSHIAAINIKSTKAKNLYIGLKIIKTPDNALFRFSADKETRAVEKTGKEMKADALIVANDGKNDAIVYISGPDNYDNVTVEIELPPNVSTDDLELSLPNLTHSFFLTEEIANSPAFSSPAILTPGGTGQSLYCQADISCESIQPLASDAVVGLEFRGGWCTGTYIRDDAGSSGYIVTAAHCIREAAKAATVKTFWFYKNTSCYSNTTRRVEGSGVIYLASHEPTDSTLLRLNGAPPAGAYAMGWDGFHNPQYFDPVTSIHHPQFDAQKISRGNNNQFYILGAGMKIGENASPSTAWNSETSTMVGTDMLIEPGSSGSGIFKNANSSNVKFIGVTSFYWPNQPPTCSGTNHSVYGRFDKAYQAIFSEWLSPNGYKPVNRFYNTQTGAHFFTMSTSEKNTVLTNYPQYQLEGVAFNASAVSAAALQPVHRFYNTVSKAHFYTIYDSERAYVAANLPSFLYEGVGWYASTQSVSETTPLYRFFNTATGAHFYTRYETEKNSVQAYLPQFKYEGVAYHVRP